MPVKYQRLDARCALTFVTWMREPVARLLSHFEYWRGSYDEKTAAPDHRQVIEEGWTLEQFCLSERFRNIYTQYLWGFPIENFDYVGITEHYSEDMLEFSERFLSASLQFRCLNVTGYGAPSRIADEVFLEKVRDFHAADLQLYQRALQWRLARLRGDFDYKWREIAHNLIDPAALARQLKCADE